MADGNSFDFPAGDGDAEKKAADDFVADRLQFSVWAMPPPGSPLRARLTDAITRFGRMFGGPVFEPHVTISGGIRGESEEQVIGLFKSVCDDVHPFSCRAVDLAFGTSFFQCAYLLMAKSAELVEASMRTKRQFGLLDANDVNEARDAYMPHLSLIYGKLSEEEKKQVAKMIEQDMNDLVMSTEFPVASLCLYRTVSSDLTLKSWEKVAEFQLGGQNGLQA